MLCCGSITRNDILCCGSFTPILCCVVDRSLGMIYWVVDRSRRNCLERHVLNVVLFRTPCSKRCGGRLEHGVRDSCRCRENDNDIKRSNIKCREAICPTNRNTPEQPIQKYTPKIDVPSTLTREIARAEKNTYLGLGNTKRYMIQLVRTTTIKTITLNWEHTYK